MRLTKEQAAQNRSAIVEAAGRLFRERGFDAVSVADLMDAAGFTHGGFYNHFESKEALAKEVATAGIQRSREIGARGAREDANPLSAHVDAYLSKAHRDDPANGCTLAALAGDVARQAAALQEPFRMGLEAFIEATTAQMLARAGGKTRPARVAARRRAMRLWSELVGAVVLSRAVAASSPELSDELLKASREGCKAELE